MLHSETEKLLNELLLSDDPQLIKHLFEEAQVLEWIIEASKDQYIELHAKGRRLRKGYLGHLTRIANSIIDFSIQNKTLLNYLEGT